MSVGDEDITTGSNQNIGRLIERVLTVAGNYGLPQSHQDLPLRTELENLVALSVLSLGIGDPHISCLVHEDTVRKDEQPRAEALHQLAGRGELKNSIYLQNLAVKLSK